MNNITKFKLLAILLLGSICAKAQNPLVIVPSGYVKPDPLIQNPPLTPLPIAPAGSVGYIGTSSSGPSSIYAGTDGKPLVFASVSGDVHLPLSTIVGETTTLYNKNGYLIGGLNQLSNLPFQGLEEKEVISNNETIIVPDPGNCKRFYVLGTAENFSDLPPSGGVADNGYFPFFAVVDLSLPITNAPLGEFGQITTPGATSQMNIKNLHDLVPNLPFGGVNNNRPHTVTTKIAVTKSNVNDGNSRLIFVYSDGYMFIYKLSASGINFLQFSALAGSGGTLFPMGGATFGNMLGEMEIYEEANKIKFAVPISKSDANNSPQPDLGLFEMSTASFPFVFSNPKVVYVSNGVPLNYHNSQVGGVEFSPNGQYVYFTHEPNANKPNPIEWVEYANITNRGSVISASAADFQRSQIELGLDGKMYFATSNRLATLSNPNTPSAPGWNNSAVSLTNYPTYQGAYCLPDQIDQDTYGGFYENTIPCCYLYSKFNIEKDFYFPVGNTVIGPVFPVQVTGKDSYGFPMTVEFTSTTTTKGNIYIPEKASVTFNNLRLEFKPEYIPVNPNDPEDVYTPGVGLIVKRASNAPNNGGRLTTNASTLTVYNKCDQKKMWPGVEVWGYNIANQGTFNTSVEGWMKLNAGSVIERAITGVTIGDINGGQGGGVVEGTSATIQNCQTALYITAAGAPLANKTIFTNTEFKLTQVLIDVNRVPEKLVKSVDVVGVRFRSCKFFNTYTPYNQTVYGVLSTNSKINFTQWGARSVFENLAFGIYASSTIAGRVINCHYSDFTRNIVGAYITTTNSCSFTNNRFKMIDDKNNSQYFSTGLILTQSSKFTISDNYFSNANNATVYANNPTIGIIIDNSNPSPIVGEDNFIVKNKFERLFFGIQCKDKNFHNYISSNASSNEGGLVMYCNDFNANTPQSIFWADICTSIGANGVAGIRNKQGVDDGNDKAFAANNKFSYTPYGATSILQTSQALNIQYHWSGAQSIYKPNPLSSNSVAVYFSSINTNSCGPEMIYERLMNSDVTPTVASLKSEFDLIKQKVAYGSSLEIIERIKSNASAGAIKNSLMDNAPYISDDALFTYLNTNPPAGHIQQVLSACAPLSQSLLDKVLHSKLPTGIVNMVSALPQTGLNYMDLATNQLVNINEKIDWIYKNAISDNLNVEESESAHTQALAFIKEAYKPGTCIGLKCRIDLATDDVLSATENINLLTTYLAAGTPKLEINKKLYELLNKDVKRELDLNPALYNELVAISENTSDQEAAMLAISILNYKDDRVLPIDYSGLVSAMSSSARISRGIIDEINESSEESNALNSISNFPNPFTGKTTLTAIVPDYSTSSELVVMDVLGKEVARYALQVGENAVAFDNENITGILYYSLFVNGKRKATKMMMKQ